MTDTLILRNFLPTRYSKTLQKRIFEKTGRRFSTNYISMCLAVPPVRHNELILHEAALWASEERDRRLQTATILESLSTIES